MSVLSGPEQKEVSTLNKGTIHRKALDRQRFVRDCPGPRPAADQRSFVVCSPRSWSELRDEVSRSTELSIGCVRRLTGAFANRTRKVDFSFQTIVDFVLIFLGNALGLDHHAALLIFHANLLKQAKLKVLLTAWITQNHTWSMCRDGSSNRSEYLVPL